MSKIICKRFPCEVCGKLDSIQLFYSKDGNIRYARARHYLSAVNGKPKFCYHQQSLPYCIRKLNELQKEDKPNILNGVGHNGHVGYLCNVDLEKPQSVCFGKNRVWASSSVRIEHQPLALVISYYFVFFSYFHDSLKNSYFLYCFLLVISF